MMQKLYSKFFSIWVFFILFMVAMPCLLPVSGFALSADEIFMYRGKDREKMLIEGSKKEGNLYIYASMGMVALDHLIKDFKAKYPWLKVEYYRATGEKMGSRAIAEKRGGKYVADIFEAATQDLEILKKEGITGPFYSLEAAIYPKELKDAENYWVGARLNVFVLLYNTRLVSPNNAPKTYQDLLDPKWKGKITFGRDHLDWMFQLIQFWGEKEGIEYFRKLGKQRESVRVGHSAIGALVSAGEVTMSPHIFNNIGAELQQTGASVDWVNLEPSVVQINAVSRALKAPHPHAAALFVDFILSVEGQQNLRQYTQRIPARPGVAANPPRLTQGFERIYLDVKKELQEYDKWVDIYKKLLIDQPI